MKALKFSSFILTASLLLTGLSMPEAKAEYLRESGGQYPTRDGLVQQMSPSSSFLIAGSDRHLGGRGDRHGRSDDLPSLQRQLDELGKQYGRAGTKREKVKIKTKIRNVEKEIRQRLKGEHHGQREKGQQRHPTIRLDPPGLADTP